MPITIGAKQESDFNDPIGMLSDCHRRIERFLGVLEKLARDRRGGTLGDQERIALATSLRYFRESAPKHTADEEESLFPRLRTAGGADVATLFERIGALEKDHETAEMAHREVDQLGTRWLQDGSLPSDKAARLAALLAELTGLYARHIAIEDSEVFPTAKAMLAPADRQAVGAEMAARRGVDPSTSRK